MLRTEGPGEKVQGTRLKVSVKTINMSKLKFQIKSKIQTNMAEAQDEKNIGQGVKLTFTF